MTYFSIKSLTLEHLKQLDQLGWVEIQIPELWIALLKQASVILQNNDFKQALIKTKNKALKSELIRNDLTAWIETDSKNAAEVIFLNLIQNFMSDLSLYFRISLDHFEAHYALYEKDHFYSRHTDQKLINNKRFFSFVYYLNNQWQVKDGGILTGYLNKTKTEIFNIKPIAGTFIIFKSDIEHQVHTSFAPRYSVTGWFRTA